MADLRISDLVTASQLKNDDYYEIAQSESGTRVSYKTTLLAIAVQIATMVDFTSDLNTTSKKITGAINELKQLISLIPQFSIEVVQELPTEDISDTTIYLVPAEDPEVGNYYEEYIYVNNTWELVGTTAVDLSAYYTKLEVDGLLATKASVAEVALKENKSDMPTDVRTIIKDCKTPKSATITNGIAQFECIEENLVKGLKITMSPIQSGSGNPSPTNIRPFTGRTEASVKRTGKNQCDPSVFNGVSHYTVNADESITVNSSDTRSWSNVLEQPLKAGTYTVIKSGTTGTSDIRLSTEEFNTGHIFTTSFTFTLATDGSVKIKLAYGGITYPQTYTLQIESGSTATTYEPYTAETHTHQYGQTVYGGEDDFVNGGLTNTKKYIELDANSNWEVGTGAVWFFIGGDTDLPTGTIVDSRLCSNMFKNGYNQDDSIWVIYRQIHVRPNSTIAPSGATAEGLAEFKNWLSTNNYKIQVCVELATPTTISTSAEEITTVSGTNIISGTEPISECKYTELATVDDLRKIIGGQ